MQHTDLPHFHFHVDRLSSDCDGRHESEDVITAYAGQSGRLAWTRYVEHVVRFFDCTATGGQVMRRYSDGDGSAVLEHGGPTDEGFRTERAVTCWDEDCLSPSYRLHYRDHYAELAGY